MPKTPKRPQWQVRLDRYHRFVVKQLMDATEAGRSTVLERMIVMWVADHPDQVAQAGASMDAWKNVRGELGDEELGDDEEE